MQRTILTIISLYFMKSEQYVCTRFKAANIFTKISFRKSLKITMTNMITKPLSEFKKVTLAIDL
jgi:hypothetical protein